MDLKKYIKRKPELIPDLDDEHKERIEKPKELPICLLEARVTDTGQVDETFKLINSFSGLQLLVDKDKYDEVLKMEENVSWDEATQDKFVAFEEGVRTKIKVTDWSMKREKVKKYKSEEFELGVVFNARVVEQDGVKVDKVINTQSKRLMQALRSFLENQDPSETIHLSVKKIGKEQATNYDVELVETLGL